MTLPKRPKPNSPTQTNSGAHPNHNTPARSETNGPKKSKSHPLSKNDLHATRMEVDSFRQKISTLSSAQPQKAAIILADWLNKPSLSQRRDKKAA